MSFKEAKLSVNKFKDFDTAMPYVREVVFPLLNNN